MKIRKPLQRVRWLNPIIFSHVDAVAREVGYPFSPKEIARRLKQRCPDLFAKFAPQRISDWRDPKFPDRLVWRPFVLTALERGDVPQKKVTRKYILVGLCCLFCWTVPLLMPT